MLFVAVCYCLLLLAAVCCFLLVFLLLFRFVCCCLLLLAATCCTAWRRRAAACWAAAEHGPGRAATTAPPPAQHPVYTWLRIILDEYARMQYVPRISWYKSQVWMNALGVPQNAFLIHAHVYVQFMDRIFYTYTYRGPPAGLHIHVHMIGRTLNDWQCACATSS